MPLPGRFTPWKKTWYQLYRRLGGPQGRYGLTRKILLSIGIRSPDLPVCSKSLYWLSYSGSNQVEYPLLSSTEVTMGRAVPLLPLCVGHGKLRGDICLYLYILCWNVLQYYSHTTVLVLFFFFYWGYHRCVLTVRFQGQLVLFESTSLKIHTSYKYMHSSLILFSLYHAKFQWWLSDA